MSRQSTAGSRQCWHDRAWTHGLSTGRQRSWSAHDKVWARVRPTHDNARCMHDNVLQARLRARQVLQVCPTVNSALFGLLFMDTVQKKKKNAS